MSGCRSPFLKKGSPVEACNYCLSSLISIACKVFERFIGRHLKTSPETVSSAKHSAWFAEWRSCPTNLLSALNTNTQLVDKGKTSQYASWTSARYSMSLNIVFSVSSLSPLDVPSLVVGWIRCYPVDQTFKARSEDLIS